MNESGYRLLFEANPQPMFVFDLESFRFLDVNDAAVRDYGYSREEFLGMTILDIRPSQEVARFKEHFNRNLVQTAKRGLRNMKGWKHLRKDGSVMEVEVGWSRVPFKGLDAWLVVVKDVSEQRRAEDEIQKSAEQFRALFRHVPMPTYCWRAVDGDFELVGFNEAAEEITRGTIQQWVGKRAGDIYPDRPDVPADFHLCLREKKTIRKEMAYRMRSTGEDKYFSVVYTHVPPDMVLAHTEDITDRILAERAAHRSEERFYKAFHANPAAIVISSVDTGEIIDANESFCRVYGFQREEVIGRISLELGLWPSAEERNRLVRELNAGGRLRNVETTVRTRSGEDRLVSLSTEFLELEERRCILSILQDITERKRMEEKLRYNERLKQQVLESVPGGVVYVDKEGAVREANAEALALMGLSYDHFTSTYVSDYAPITIREDGSPCDVEDYPVSKCLKTQQPQPKTTIGVVKPDGSVTWAVYAAIPVFAKDTGAFSGAVVTFLDVTPRKVAEEALRESELRFRQLAENIHEVFWMRDPQRRQMLYVSPAFETIWGRSRQSLYQDPGSYLGGIHPDDRTVAIRAEEEQRLGLTTSVEYRVIRPDNQERWVRDRGFPILKNGTVERVAGVAEDITEYRRTLVALRESETIYRTLAESTGVGIWQMTREGITIYANPALCAILGVAEPSKLVGRSYQEFFTPKSIQRIQAELQKRDKGLASSYEAETVRPDGTHRNLLVFGGPFFAADGKLHSVIGSFVDITDRKRIEQEASNLVSLVENTSDFISIVDMEGRLVFVNQGGKKLVGLSPAEDVRKLSIPDFLPPEVWQQVQAVEIPTVKKDGFFRGKGALRHFETGKAIPVQVVALLLRHPETRQPIGMATVQRDITEQQAAEHALQDYAERLRNLSSRLLQAQEAERRHIARELHDEIGQTLTATKLSLQAAQRTSDPKIQEGKLLDGVQLVERLLDQVRNLSLDLCPPQLDFLGLVPALRSYVEEQAERAGFQAQFFADGTIGRLPSMIEVACFRVAQEAVTNVVRHAQARNVSVRLLQDVEALHLYVRDDGIGFDFAAAHERAGRGESLGILGMEERMALLGGKMSCQSKRNGGTEVHAWFPLENTAQPSNEVLE